MSGRFGRSDKADCQILNDPVISRLHFLIETSPPTARIQDLGYVNGIHVNEKKYDGSAD